MAANQTTIDRIALAELSIMAGITEELVKRADELSKNFSIGQVNDGAPLRNVLTVATDPSAGPKVVENFILYQMGRSNASKIWKQEHNGEKFATALVRELKSVQDLATRAVSDIERTAGETMSPERTIKLKLKLIQLFLGYLSRYHVAYKRGR